MAHQRGGHINRRSVGPAAHPVVADPHQLAVFTDEAESRLVFWDINMLMIMPRLDENKVWRG